VLEPTVIAANPYPPNQGAWFFGGFSLLPQVAANVWRHLGNVCEGARARESGGFACIHPKLLLFHPTESH
jgi:hypothetical protein